MSDRAVLHIQKVKSIAGSEKHLLNLLPMLKKHGFSPSMLVLADKEDNPDFFIEKMKNSGISTDVMPVAGDLSPALVFKLADYIQKSRYNIVHTHLIHADLYGTAAAKLAGIKTIISTRHNDDRFRRFLPFKLLIKLQHSFCSHIICISHYLKKFCFEKEGIPENKMSVILYGYPQIETTHNSFWKKQFGLEKNRILGMVARLTGQKGHSTLLHAAKGVFEKFPDVRLVIAGDGELEKTLKKLSDKLKINERVLFAGYWDDAASRMAGFDIFVHPSRWEGFGIVFLEAMAAKLPVVATRVSAIPEIVEHDKTGLLVPVDNPDALKNAICRLLSDRDLAREMGNRGFKSLKEKFSLENMVAKTAGVYNNKLQEPN